MPFVKCLSGFAEVLYQVLSGPLNRLNAILSLLHPSTAIYRTPSAIGSAIGRPGLTPKQTRFVPGTDLVCPRLCHSGDEGWQKKCVCVCVKSLCAFFAC